LVIGCSAVGSRGNPGRSGGSGARDGRGRGSSWIGALAGRGCYLVDAHSPYWAGFIHDDGGDAGTSGSGVAVVDDSAGRTGSLSRQRLHRYPAGGGVAHIGARCCVLLGAYGHRGSGPLARAGAPSEWTLWGDFDFTLLGLEKALKVLTRYTAKRIIATVATRGFGDHGRYVCADKAPASCRSAPSSGCRV